MEYIDYYKILGVSRDASQPEIKKSYRRLAHKFHPDISKESNAEQRFKEIGEAYEVLKDPEKRVSYDQLGEDWKNGQKFHAPPGWNSQSGFGQQSAAGSGFSDFFESIFSGGGFGPGPGGRPGPHPNMRGKGADQNTSVHISLSQAYRGDEITVRLSNKKTLKVRIPKGVGDGQKIRLSGQGSDGLGAPGDLYIEVNIKPHPLYRLDGKDIELRLPITPWEAALGAKVTAPLLSGKIQLTVPEGSTSGKRMRLKGKGMPGKPDGDFYVVLEVAVPPAKGDVQREMYEQMEKLFEFNPRESLDSL
jgi:curved DNA-binding protein